MALLAMKYQGKIKGKIIVSAAANQTYTKQLQDLQSTWNGLSVNERLACIMQRGSTGKTAQCVDANTGVFMSLYYSGSAFNVEYFDIPNGSARGGNFNSSSDIGSYTNAQTLDLYMLDED